MSFSPVRLDNPESTSVARKGILSMLTIGLQGGTRFISNWLIGRIAGRLVLGLVSTASSLAYMLNILWTASAQSGASKFISRARGRNDSTEASAVARHLGLRVLQVAIGLSLVAPAVWILIYDGTIGEGLCISLMLITVAASQFARGVHFGAGQIARGTKYDVVTSVIGIAATLIMLACGVRGIVLTLPITIALGVYSLCCWPWTAVGKPEKNLRQEVDSFVTMSALGSIASAGMLQASQLVAMGIGHDAAAQYAPALQLVTPLSMVSSALTMVFFPSMAEAQGAGDKQRLNRQTRLYTRMFLALLVGVFGVVAIASRPIIHVIWGASFANAAQLMPLFCVALLMQNISSPAVSALVTGRGRNTIYTTLLSHLGLISAVIVWIACIKNLAVMGVALGYAIGSVVTSVGIIALAFNLSKMSWWGIGGKLLAGVVIFLSLSGLVQHLNKSFLLDLTLALAFGLFWAIICYQELKQSYNLLKSKNQ